MATLERVKIERKFIQIIDADPPACGTVLLLHSSILVLFDQVILQVLDIRVFLVCQTTF